MPYNLKYFDGRAFITLADGVVDQQASSSLYLIGKDVTSYGTIQNDNFLWLLENFAGTVEPVNKVQGQIWFDKTSSILKPKVYDGAEWRTFSTIAASSTSATNATVGDLWYDTSRDQLFIKNTLSDYTLVGPESVPGFGKTKFLSRTVKDLTNASHACIVMYVDDAVLGAVSNDEFYVNTSDEIYLAGIEVIGRGFNFASGATVSSDDVYLRAEADETITGRWTFNSINGIGIGTSTIFPSESGNLTLQSIGRSVVINANELRPSGSTVTLGTTSNKFAKVYASEFNAGSSVSSANLTGKFILTASSKIEPGTDGSINMGAANARFATVFTKGLNAGGTTEEGVVVGNWKLDTGSTLDVSDGVFVSADASMGSLDVGVVNATIVNADKVVTRFITAGTSSTTGLIEGDWSLTASSRLRAVYADIAEKYATDAQYEPGTVVMFGGDKEVTIANLPSTTKVAGIVTTEPAQILNTNLEDAVAIALVGRVPCKVVGTIFKGDMLVVSDIPGVLTSSVAPKTGSLVAKALEFYNSTEVGFIEVMVARG
jgi:hypothetical protein